MSYLRRIEEVGKEAAKNFAFYSLYELRRDIQEITPGLRDRTFYSLYELHSPSIRETITYAKLLSILFMSYYLWSASRPPAGS